MTHVFTRLRGAFTMAVVALTIAWSVGLSLLISPFAASAATSGSLIKASQAAVYYMGSDGKRYVFPNEATYKTWYADFSGVTKITDAELASIAIGGNVTMKPGAKMVKITTDPKVYAVDAHGVLRWVKTEGAAVGLYGSNWNHMILDIPDAFFTNYTVGGDISSTSDFNASGVTTMASSINADKGLGASVSGALSAQLSKDNPGAQTIMGGIGATMLEFTVSNSSSTAQTLDSLTVHRSGSGATGDFAGIYLYKDVVQRITSGRTLNSTSNDASFSGLNVTVPAGGSALLEVVGTFNQSPGGSNQHALSLTDLRSGSTVVSGLPLNGSTFTMSTSNVGVATITKSGSSPLSNVKAGGLQQKIGEFQIQNDSVEAGYLAEVELTIGGTISRDKVTNITLKQGGATIATAPGYSKYDRATLVIDPGTFIDKGSAKTFQVFADIAANARANETVFTYLDDASDVTEVGGTYGMAMTTLTATSYGGSYDGASCAWGSGNCSSTKVDAGQLTVTFNGPAAKDVASNGKDVEIFNFTMAAGSNLEVRKLKLTIDGNGDLDDGSTATPRVSDIKIVDTATGATVMGPKDSTAGTSYVVADNSSVLDYTEVFSLSAGQARTFKVTADIGNDATLTGGQNLTTVKVTLGQFSALSSAIRNLDSSQDLQAADYVPDAAIAGNTHTLKSPTLAVSVASTPVTQTFVQGTQGIPMFGFNLKAGDASDVKVSSIKVTGYVDNNNVNTFVKGTDGTATVSSIVLQGKLWNGSTQIGTTKSPTSGAGGEMTFDNLNLTIAKGQTITLTLSGNLASAIASVAANSDRIKWDVTAAADISATDVDGNALNVSGSPINGTTANSGVRMTVAAAGSVAIVLAPDDIESEAGLVVGNSSNAVLAKYKFSATAEELKLAKVRFTTAGATGVNSISLYDGATLVAGPASVDGSGNADFSSMNFVIPKDGSKVLTVKGNLNSVGSSGATSGTNLQLTMDNVGSPTLFEVRGTSAGSNTLITDTNVGAGNSPTADLGANVKRLVRTKPTVSLVALPSTVLTAGDQSVARFTVSADAAGDVSLKGLTFALSKTTLITAAVTANSSIRRVGDGTNLAGNSALDASCNAAAVACTVYVDFGTGATGEEVIAAGTSKTYDLRLTLGAIPSGSSSVSVSMSTDAAAEYGAVTAATGPALAKITTNPGVFVWSDNSASSHSAAYASSSSDWATGKYVKSLPSDSQTMSK